MSQTALVIIEKEIRSNEVMTRISDSLGKPATDPSVKKFLNGAIMYIQSKIGTKGDVSHCTKQSIIDSLICAATVRLPVDSKHYACLIAYASICTYQPEWRGYVAKVKEADPSAKVTAYLIFKGDKFSHKTCNGEAFYTHERKDSLNDNIDDMAGAFCYIKTATGSSIKVLSREQLDNIRASSKAGYAYIWKDWPHEQYLKTIIRSACKIEFTEAVAALDALDNRMYVDKTQREIPTLAKTAPMPEEKPIMEAEVIEDGEKKEAGAPADDTEALKKSAEEAKKRKEALEEEELLKGQAQEAPGDAQEEQEGETKAPDLEPGQLLAEGLINAVIEPKGKSYYVKFTLKGHSDKFFSTNNPITTEKLRIAKEKGKTVRIIYTETAWTGGMNQNIVSAEVLNAPVSDERAY